MRLKFGTSISKCFRCGDNIRFLAVDSGWRVKPFNSDNDQPHLCKHIVVKIYDDKEKKEFELKRLSGEI